MKKRVSVSAILAGLIMAAVAMSAHPGFLAGELPASLQSAGIDPSLEEKLSLNEKNIPFIILFKDSNRPDAAELDAAGLKIKHKYRIINGGASVGSAEDIRRLAGLKWVDRICLDGTVHVSRQVRNETVSDASSPYKMVNAEALWSQGINGTGIRVAVIDSGIDKNHPDLTGKVIDEINFVEAEETTEDLLGHGTICAGIIAGSGQASGGRYKGIAPGATLLNVRVIDSDGDGQVSDIISGMEWALDNNADILSMSLGGMNPGEINPPLTMAADKAMDAGAIVCVAAGNSY